MIDAHCHFWLLDRGDYGWLNEGGDALAPIRRDFLPADYRPANTIIAVQAAPAVAETEFLLDLASHDERIAGVVGWVDLAAPSAAAELGRLAQNRRLRGIRPMLQDIEDTGWLVEQARPEAIRAVTDLGLCLDALVTERHLPMLARFAAGNRGLPLIIDHAAKPQPTDRERWAAGMRALAEIPHVHCKLSGLMSELAPEERADPLPALRPVFRSLIDWFGPWRLVWGSDWPVLTLAASWQRWRDLTGALVDELAPAEAEAILGGNAARFYGVQP